MSGLQGFRFGNRKAELLQRRMAELKSSTEARRRLMGLKPTKAKK